jgi:hypothetical protein
MQRQLPPFQLAIEPLPNASYSLSLLQRPFPTKRHGRALPYIEAGRIEGLALASAQEHIL